MSAAAALKLAEAAGIDIIVDGPNLLLEAPATPSPAVVAEIKRNKAAIIELLRPAGSGAAVPAEWIAGLNKLRTVDHFPGFSAEQWRQLCESGAAFLERWGATADKVGWNEIDIFGVIRSLGSRGQTLRQVGQRVGLVPLTRDGEVVEIAADRSTIRYASGSELVYLRRSVRDAVPLWDLLE